MCEYCDGKLVKELNMSKPLLSGYCDNLGQEILIVIKEKEIRIYNDEDAGYTYIDINYCPLCGRKLGE